MEVLLIVVEFVLEIDLVSLKNLMGDIIKLLDWIRYLIILTHSLPCRSPVSD